MININNILRCFPLDLSRKIDRVLAREDVNLNLLEEIRIRVNRPVILKIGQVEFIIEHIITGEEIIEILSSVCENSIYTYQEQICNRLYNNTWRT